MLSLVIPGEGYLQLQFEPQMPDQYVGCRLNLCRGGKTICLCEEDDLYFYVIAMVNRLRNVPQLTDPYLLGGVGRWQEYYYFDGEDIKAHQRDIDAMESAVLVSGQMYGSFLYQCGDKIWMEIDKGYTDHCCATPKAYYASPDHYRTLLCEISPQTVHAWLEQLCALQDEIERGREGSFHE